MYSSTHARQSRCEPLWTVALGVRHATCQLKQGRSAGSTPLPYTSLYCINHLLSIVVRQYAAAVFLTMPLYSFTWCSRVCLQRARLSTGPRTATGSLLPQERLPELVRLIHNSTDIVSTVTATATATAFATAVAITTKCCWAAYHICRCSTAHAARDDTCATETLSSGCWPYYFTCLRLCVTPVLLCSLLTLS
jgi:hypothetical protein